MHDNVQVHRKLDTGLYDNTGAGAVRAITEDQDPTTNQDYGSRTG